MERIVKKYINIYICKDTIRLRVSLYICIYISKWSELDPDTVPLNTHSIPENISGLRMSRFRKVAEEFGGKSTIHGFSYIFPSQELYEKSS